MMRIRPTYSRLRMKCKLTHGLDICNLTHRIRPANYIQPGGNKNTATYATQAG